MPTMHIHTTYTYKELSGEAKKEAVEEIQKRLGGSWWDSGDNDDIAATMLYALAEKFESPGWNEYGPGDFPGIEGLTVEEWDVERGTYKLGGYLNAKTAPALPWNEGGYQFVFGRHGSYLEWSEHYEDYSDAKRDQVLQKFDDKIRDAISEALSAGRKEVEYKTSEEYAKEWIKGNEPDFNEDGTLHI